MKKKKKKKKKKKIINEKDWGPERKKRVREKHANNGVVIIRLFQ